MITKNNYASRTYWYDLQKESFGPIAEINKALRPDCDVSVLAYNNIIYFFANNYKLDVERGNNLEERFYFFQYDLVGVTDTLRFRSLKRMRYERRQVASIGCGNELFIFGGNGNDEILASCECYNIVNDSWRMIAELPKPRYSCQAVVFSACIIAVYGGQVLNGMVDDEDYVESDDVLFYHIDTNTWSTPKWKLPTCTDTMSFCSSLHVLAEFDELVFISDSCDTWIFDLSTCTWNKIIDCEKEPNLLELDGKSMVICY